ncbi:MAG: exosortase A [Erythrobacter sp.]
MPPEAAPSSAGRTAWASRIAPQWREPLVALAAVAALMMLVTFREWGEMAHQWWHIDTYSHILLIGPIIAWLVALKRAELAQITPQGWLPGLGVTGAALLIWLIGRGSEINLIAHAGAVGALQGAVLAVLGPRAALTIALPLAMGAFLVPFGDEIIPPLQAITARIAVALTHWSGVNATIDGINIHTPAGWFIVAEACSGVKFLVAMVTLGVLVCFTRFASWKRRGLFMLAAVIVPVLANGVRAWGTIYLAQFYGAEVAAGFDHIIYGWVFFGIVVAVLLAGAWRWFEREPEEYGWSAGEVAALPIMARLDGMQAPLPMLLSLFAVLALAASALAAFMPALTPG